MSTQGWTIPGWRQVGAPLSTIAAAYTQFWDSTKFYPATDLIVPNSGNPGLSYNAGNDAADLIYAWPMTFMRAGLLTSFGQHCGNNNGRMWLGLYDSAPATPQIPRNRLFDGEKVAVGFHQPMVVTPVNVAIKAGRTYWFAQVFNANVPGGGCLQTSPQFGRPWMGTDYTGAAGAATANTIIAIRTAFAYARLPDPFPNTPTYWKSNQAGLPCMVYTFTPDSTSDPL